MGPAPVIDIPARLRLVEEEIALAARGAGRDAKSIKLVAVTKTVPPEEIGQAVAAGQSRFGENRVQEAQAKWPALKQRHPGIELHLMRHLGGDVEHVPRAELHFGAAAD